MEVHQDRGEPPLEEEIMRMLDKHNADERYLTSLLAFATGLAVPPVREEVSA